MGLQTDEASKAGLQPLWRHAHGALRLLRPYGCEVSPKIEEEFKYHKTHNDGVFSAYTPEIKAARHVGLITGLPDAYGRGRIIGDYRRVALYGIDRLIEQKKADKIALGDCVMSSPSIRAAEELHDQIQALEDMKTMAQMYGYDISGPAKNAREAVQWLYFGYLAAIKEQNGAAMSLGGCPPSWTSTLSGTCRPASSPRSRPRRSSTTLS